MGMFLMLAWRNIWRNPVRTSVILCGVVVGVWCMVCLGGIMRGMVENMIQTGIATLGGHIRIHAAGYRDDPSVERRIDDPDGVIRKVIGLLPGGSELRIRVRLPGVMQNARHSAGVVLVGVDPDRDPVVELVGAFEAGEEQSGLRSGRTLIAGRARVELFETGPDHRVVVMGVDAKGEIVSRGFVLGPVFRSPLESTEKRFVFLRLDTARDMFGLGGGATEIAVTLPDRSLVEKTTVLLRSAAGREYEVFSWQEMLPMVSSYLEIYDTFMVLWYVVVFAAMGFGIANTMLMAVMERIREFGLLKALGMRSSRVVLLVLSETGMILVLGIMFGDLLGWISMAWLGRTGIDLSAYAAGSEMVGMSRVVFPVWAPGDTVLADAVVLGLGLVVGAYPAVRAARFTPVQAMRRE
jgi:ABC-type lipoprotein release transport system permease subunit